MGGGLAQSIPQKGILQHGRLWDIEDTSSLGLGESASHLLSSLERAFHGSGSTSVPKLGKGQGDAIFFHIIAGLLQGQPKLHTFSTKLVARSPFTRLCRCPQSIDDNKLRLPSMEEGSAALLHQEAEDLQGHPLMGFFLGYIADQWSKLPNPDPQIPIEQQLETLRRWQATLLLWMETCARTGRLSLWSVFPLWWSRLLSEHFVEKVTEIQEFRNMRLSQREALIFCYADFLRLGESLEAMIEKHITLPGPYGWEDPAEVRAFLGNAGRHWTSGGLQEQVTQAQHRLRRVLN